MLCLHHNIVILLVFCSFCISAIEQQHSQKHDRRKWRIPIIVNNALNYDQHDQHRSEWNVIDWWQTNIDEDKLAQALSDNANYRNSMTITDFIAQPQPPPPKPPISSSSSPSSSTSSSSPSLSFAVAAHLTASHAKRPFASLEHDLVGDGWVVDDSGDLHIAESIQLKQFHKPDNGTHLRQEFIPSRNKASYSFAPKSSLTSIKTLFYDYFTSVRNGMQNQAGYMALKRDLQEKFMDYGLKTVIQGFWPNIPQRNDKGHNIIGIYPGKYRNTARGRDDSIIIIGAHFDTVFRSPGVEDNGSGSVAVLEMARLLQQHQCVLNTTIIFVLFDMEEDGLIGSKHFVRNYLYPIEIEKNHVPVKGAIIVDMLLEYDDSENSQMVQGIGHLLPEWNDRVRRNRYRADFAAVWARRNIDNTLFKTLQSNWLNQQKYKLFLMDVPLPKLGRQLTNSLENRKLKPYQTFLRSDHSSFWYPHSLKNHTINAILLTDLGPWRRKVATKYHSVADNAKLLNKANLMFLKNSIDSLMKTILEMSDGRCRQSSVIKL